MDYRTGLISTPADAKLQKQRNTSWRYSYCNDFPVLAVCRMLACEQALRGTLAAGRERKESLQLRSLRTADVFLVVASQEKQRPEIRLRFAGQQLRLWNLNSTSSSPVASRRLSCRISANQREAETSANIDKYWKTRAKGNDVITNILSANQHYASTFSMQIFKFQRRSCKLSFLFPPRRQSTTDSLLAG